MIINAVQKNIFTVSLLLFRFSGHKAYFEKYEWPFFTKLGFSSKIGSNKWFVKVGYRQIKPKNHS